jgi:DNA-binding NtrC family response regulator
MAPHANNNQPARRAVFSELLKTKERIDPKCSYIGQSLAILKAFSSIEIFNRSPDEPVLITGKPGTGKSVIAKLIHDASTRAGKAFHCEQASDNMASDFSIIKARWAGIGKSSGLPNVPKAGQPGLLEQYKGGTIFMDEIHHVPHPFQVFLLNVLDRRAIPVAAGVGKDVEPNVRLVFATNEDLRARVEADRFRHDLFARIKARVLEIPPLDDRKEDIPLFVAAFCREHRYASKFLLCLLRQTWHDNVRELKTMLGMAKDEAGPNVRQLTPKHLSKFIDHAVFKSVEKMTDKGADDEVFATLWEMLEKQGWRKGRGLQGELAKLLGMSAATVSRRAAQNQQRCSIYQLLKVRTCRIWVAKQTDYWESYYRMIRN